MENLPLQVAEVDDVEVDEADRADAGGREIHRNRRSKSAGANAEHLRRLELALPVDADLRHDQVPRVALHLVIRQRRKITVRLKPDTTGALVDLGRWSAAGDRRDDAHRVVRGDRRLLLLQIADVLVVD